MSCVTSIGANVFMTMYLLVMTGCVAQKVYFDCGAKVDVVDVQGLILSPGFPYNYSSGTHCVWQFFVPVDYQLILEMMDFDVFESRDLDAAQYPGLSSVEEEAFTPDSAADEGTPPAVKDEAGVARQQDWAQQVVVQEESTKMEIAKLSNSAKRSADASSDLNSTPPHSLLLVPPGDRAANAVFSSSSLLREDPNPATPPESTASTLPHPTDTPAVSPDSQPAVLDACPHDVLYISDLITFSSRFCGSKRPPSSQLVFGSSQEMVEVIMELITTTHWGRGFALLFHYHNRTEPQGERQASAPTASKVDSLLAAVSGAAFFAVILTGALCIIFRPKLCPKRASSCVSNNSEIPVGVQNAEAAEVNELQLVASTQACLQVHAEQTNSLTPKGSADCEMSHNVEMELSSGGLTELDLGADEVFTASSAPSSTNMPLSPHTQRERCLRHSDTGPNPKDWPDPTASPTGTRAAKDSSSISARPRAWSVRTFQDLLPPLPQLHKKWCSWNSTSPFTKLVDGAPSSLVADDSRKVFSDAHLEVRADHRPSPDCFHGNASYPLSQPAQRQRRLNSASNLRRPRFFGLLSGTPDLGKPSGTAHAQPPPANGPLRSPSSCQLPGESSQTRKRRDFPAEGDHIISEEEDRQPLVLAEQVAQASATPVPNGAAMGAYECKRADMGRGCLSLQKQASSPHFQQVGPEWKPWGSQEPGGGGLHPSTVMDTPPSLSQSTVPCSVPCKDM